MAPMPLSIAAYLRSSSATDPDIPYGSTPERRELATWNEDGYRVRGCYKLRKQPHAE